MAARLRNGVECCRSQRDFLSVSCTPDLNAFIVRTKNGQDLGQEVFSVLSAQVCFSPPNCTTSFCKRRNVNSGRATACAGILRAGASLWKCCPRTSGDEFQLREDIFILTEENTADCPHDREREGGKERSGLTESRSVLPKVRCFMGPSSLLSSAESV